MTIKFLGTQKMAAWDKPSLSKDLRLALHAVALDAVSGLGRPRLQTQLLLETVLSQEDSDLQDELLPLIEDPDYFSWEISHPRLAWLLALVGDHPRFEALIDSVSYGTESPRFYEHNLTPIRWKPGMSILFEEFVKYATLPQFNLAVRFLWPRYYSGPGYRALKLAVNNQNIELLKQLLQNYDANPHMILLYAHQEAWWAQPEYELDLPERYFRAAFAAAVDIAEVELVQPLLRLYPQTRLARYISWLHPYQLPMLLELRPLELLELLASPGQCRYSVDTAREALEGLPVELLRQHLELATKVVAELRRRGMEALAQGLELKLV